MGVTSRAGAAYPFGVLTFTTSGLWNSHCPVLCFCPVHLEYVFVSVIESFDDTKGMIKSRKLKDGQ
jgi:hypothetical protein